METEGVVQYRLLGAHPAASGRYHSFGFSGETVAVAAILRDAVRQHQINLAKYKLDVRRVAERPGAESGALQPASALHTYDRIAIYVSPRHYADGVAEAAQDAARAREERLRHVEGILDSGGENINEREDERADAPRRGTGEEATESAKDPQAFARVTALASKVFPLLPGLQRRYPTRPLPVPKKGICVLCEINCFCPKELSCCRFSVCAKCLELAKTMTTKEEECVVCGKEESVEASSLRRDSLVKRESIKSEHSNVHGNAGSSKPGTSLASPVAMAFESRLNADMTRLLSQLDAPDPLSLAAKKNRRVSEVLAPYAYL